MQRRDLTATPTDPLLGPGFTSLTLCHPMSAKNAAVTVEEPAISGAVKLSRALHTSAKTSPTWYVTGSPGRNPVIRTVWCHWHIGEPPPYCTQAGQTELPPAWLVRAADSFVGATCAQRTLLLIGRRVDHITVMLPGPAKDRWIPVGVPGGCVDATTDGAPPSRAASSAAPITGADTITAMITAAILKCDELVAASAAFGPGTDVAAATWRRGDHRPEQADRADTDGSELEPRP